jgi:Tfp pilus assembly protein PilW
MNKRGTTLVELVLATLVLIIIVGVLSQILHRGLDSIDYGNKETELRQNARMVLERIAREMRQAIDNPQITDDRTINFNVDMDDDGASESIEYSWNQQEPPDGDLTRTEGTETTIIEGSVKNFHLTNDGNMVTVDLSLEEVFGERTYTVDLRSAIFLRRMMAQ